MRFIALTPLKFRNLEIKIGDTFRPKNEDSIKGLLAEGKVRPVAEVMGGKYRELTDWMHSFDLGRDELKETLPGLYMDIQNAIERLDSAFINEDLTAFQGALERVKSLYTQSLLKCGRKNSI
jgi:hypothetical protein